jgi:hypothetical protein
MARAERPLSGITRAATALGDPRAMPDLEWLEELLGSDYPRAEGALAEVGDLEEVERAIRVRHLSGGREFYAQFRAPFELYALVRALGPEHVVETGVSSGVSSAHLLLALERNGHGKLHSIDSPVQQLGPSLEEKESPVALPPGRHPGWAVPEELTQHWDLRIGRSQEELPPLSAGLPSIGLFLHDSLHTPAHLTFELTTIQPKLVPGAIVLADNTEWTGRAFERFAASLEVPVFHRGGSDLVGLRLPRVVAPKEAMKPLKAPAARSKGRSKRRPTSR